MSETGNVMDRTWPDLDKDSRKACAVIVLDKTALLKVKHIVDNMHCDAETLKKEVSGHPFAFDIDWEKVDWDAVYAQFEATFKED